MTFHETATDVVARFRRKILEQPDVESLGPDEVVARFAGRAGPFSYRTREAVRFNGHAVTFEHLDGPFQSCAERFIVRDSAGGATVAHEGTFTMRGGLAGWVLGVVVIRPLFERLVADELTRMAAQGATAN
jgi:hypothetical protein